MRSAPIAVGGVGGSGTRIVAQILQYLDFFIGSDLPRTLDTVWYAALFGRRDIFLDDPEELRDLADLFFRQMADPTPLDADQIARLRALQTPLRHQHKAEDVQLWLEGFIKHCDTGTPAPRWGWKIPYTHVLIDRLLAWHPTLKYIHMVRNGLDMAYSENQNQLGKWGPIFLNRNVKIDPRDSLEFWCAVQRRITRIGERYPDRVFQLSFDRLIRNPAPEIDALTRFIGAELTSAQKDEICSWIVVPDSAGRHRNHDISVLNPKDVAYALQTRPPLVAQTVS